MRRPISLYPDHLAKAVRIGELRDERAKTHKFKRRWGQGASRSKRDHRVGAVAEAGVAQWMGGYGFNEWYDRSMTELTDAAKFDRICDLETNVAIEVRGTAFTIGTGGGPLHLLLHSEDERDSAYVLVAAVDIATGHMHLVGWLPGLLGLHGFWLGDHFNNGRPCFAIPEDKLFPLETLDKHEGFLEKMAILEADGPLGYDSYDAGLDAMKLLNLQAGD